jgi:hypothetical protein
VRGRIDELLGPADEEELPEEFTKEEEPDPPGKLRMWHLLLAALLLLAIWIVGCGRTPEPHYHFMNGSKENPIDAETSRWLTEMRLHGQFFGSKKSYQDILAEAKPELEKEGFFAEDQGEYVSFWKDESERYVRRPIEIIAIYPDTFSASKKGSYILWAYRPSNSQRLGHALGL